MALNVDVAGFGICKTAQPYVTFVICVQQEKFEAWTVYRRFQSFCILRDQLISHHPAIPQLAAFDHNNFNFEYLESFRDFLNRWLQSLTCNTYILRMQAMYQFLCIDANMPPPYLEIFWGNNNNQDDDEMDMNEMFEDDDHQQQQWHDDEDEPEHETMDTVFEFEQNLHQKKSPSAKSPRNGAKKRPSNPHINPSTMPVYEDENDLRDGMDIQSLSYGQAEFLYDKKDEENMNDLTRTASGRFVVPNSPSKQPEQSSLSKPKRTISLESFKIIKLIGKGSFGKVFLVRDKASGNLYAMKVLKKDYIKRKNQVEHTRTERSVLGNVRHPFIVGLNMAFQTADKLFFVLDYCSGGELFFHLGKVGRFTEERAKFYAAQITLALEYVHSLGIIYRDLKPENVLLDRNGNVRLTDFGLSKEGVLDHSSGANSFCGTPEYIAPEVILRQGHGRAVDWWSLGALLYEMITGLPPFYSRNRETMFEKIMKADLTFPNTVGENAKDLLSRLLVRDPKQRFGSGERDAQEIKEHPFFADVNWVALATGKLTPPWVPTIAGSLDTSQFDDEFTSMMPIVSPDVRDAYFGSLDKAFEGFTFVDDSAAQYMTGRSSGRRMSGTSSTAAVLASKKH